MNDKRFKILHLITSTNVGGAEMVLYRLLKIMDSARFENIVICMTEAGPVGEKIQSLGIPVISLEMRSGKPSLPALVKMIRLVRKDPPDLLHTWMYHSDLLGAVTAVLTGIPILWGIRNTSLDPAMIKSDTIRIAHLNALLSRFIPRRIVACSDAARERHIGIGFAADKFITIPNGYDLEIFHPDPEARQSIRKSLNLEPENFTIGLIARFDPLKDHQTFIKAAEIFLKDHPRSDFLLAGKGVTNENKQLRSWVESTGEPARFHLLGLRDDIPSLMNALDINTLSSTGEAFPNVIGEAMACGVPCVSTDVGDAAFLIGDTGFVVPPGDPKALAAAWGKIHAMPAYERRDLGSRARERIQQHFSIDRICHAYETLYIQTIQK